MSTFFHFKLAYSVTAVPYGTTGSPPPQYGPPPLPRYTPAPRHYYQYAAPSYYQPAAYAPAPYKPEKPFHDDGSVTPSCALTAVKKNVSERSWCLVDEEYPARQVQLAIEYHYAAVAALYKDVVANTGNYLIQNNPIYTEI